MSPKAIIQTGGKQYLVEPGTTVTIERLPGGAAGDTVEFDDIRLLIRDGEITLGHPRVASAVVEGKILEVTKGKKVTGVKFKPRRRYLKRLGHRQLSALVEITAVKAKRPLPATPARQEKAAA